MTELSKAKTFQNLLVWQKAHSLALGIYKITKGFPEDEKYGLIPQMRRSSVSIAANISEGFKKISIKDKSNFYNIVQGSLSELRYYLILSRDLEYITDIKTLDEQADEVGRMLEGLIKSVKYPS